jgi:hypothetical protein
MRTKETKEITTLIFSCLRVAMVIFLLNCCDVGGLDFSGMDMTLPTPDLPILPIDVAPQLISPENGAVLDNGRTDQSDVITWDFEWKVRGCRPGKEDSYVYGPWSEERTFVVEPVNTDPPSRR